MSRTALFDVLFELAESETVEAAEGERWRRASSRLIGLRLVRLESLDSGGGAGLSATVVYNADMYGAATVAQMMRHFEVLLEAATADPERRIDDITLLSEAEEHQQLAEWNATVARNPRTRRSTSFPRSKSR
ncbi:MAG: hypothetical protein LC776_00895 [Acidobacteria bacterium]|nr:hypothetical protein [Acidobacteriota bacterium]